jgi:CheY-like chemotaxis protein
MFPNRGRWLCSAWGSSGWLGCAVASLPESAFLAIRASPVSSVALNSAEDGQQALVLARQKLYALILMDMQLPNLDGVDATKTIRAGSLNTATPIMVMTANAFDEDRQNYLSAGMNDHIAKPVDPQNLFGKLLGWLSKHRG